MQRGGLKEAVEALAATTPGERPAQISVDVFNMVARRAPKGGARAAVTDAFTTRCELPNTKPFGEFLGKSAVSPAGAARHGATMWVRGAAPFPEGLAVRADADALRIHHFVDAVANRSHAAEGRQDGWYVEYGCRDGRVTRDASARDFFAAPDPPVCTP